MSICFRSMLKIGKKKKSYCWIDRVSGEVFWLKCGLKMRICGIIEILNIIGLEIK